MKGKSCLSVLITQSLFQTEVIGESFCLELVLGFGNCSWKLLLCFRDLVAAMLTVVKSKNVFKNSRNRKMTDIGGFNGLLCLELSSASCQKFNLLMKSDLVWMICWFLWRNFLMSSVILFFFSLFVLLFQHLQAFQFCGDILWFPREAGRDPQHFLPADVWCWTPCFWKWYQRR